MLTVGSSLPTSNLLSGRLFRQKVVGNFGFKHIVLMQEADKAQRKVQLKTEYDEKFATKMASKIKDEEDDGLFQLLISLSLTLEIPYSRDNRRTSLHRHLPVSCPDFRSPPQISEGRGAMLL